MDLRRARQTAHANLTHAQKMAALKFFGKFDIQTLLSERGYTRVYKARDVNADREVVLKVLPANLSKNSQWIERFRREMYLAGNLKHPNLVTTYECGSAEGSPYIAMEWLDGVSIGHRLEREGNMPEAICWQIIREAAKGLAYAEEHGIVHRDIKPDNILLTADGRVKIIDMGLAKSLVVVTQLTAAGESVGTPLYMAPEQATGKSEIDSRADIYGLGCTLYHMLTGMVPFFAESATDVMLKHVQATRPDPREIFPELSEASSKLVQRMIAINPDERPPTARALLEDIEFVLRWLIINPTSRLFLPQIVPSVVPPA
jgi:serine/threonine-protein kinase